MSMLVSMAWRNLSRNRRRSVLTGAAVTFGIVLAFWLLGVKHGGFVQMVDKAVETRLGHLQVLAEGYHERPEPRLVVPDAQAVVTTLRGLDHVKAVSPRAVAEGMIVRDNESAQVEILGVDPEAERLASNVPSKLFTGDAAVRWCRTEMPEARDAMGGNEQLFARWCDAMRTGRFLPDGDDRAVVLGSGLAKSLLVSVGDEVTVQVVRAVSRDGLAQGELSPRRLEVTGLVRTNSPDVDDRIAYVNRATLMGMLGTDGPNEIAVLLDDIGELDTTLASARSSLAGTRGAVVYAWYERNPALRSLVEMGAGGNQLVYVVLFALIALGVVNATFMSVLERTKEFGVMLALGTRRSRLFALVMTEVALLGLVAVGLGTALGLGLEIFGRVHGWPMEWFGYEEVADISAAGVSYDTIYYSALSFGRGVGIVATITFMLLLAGLLPAIKASRLAPVDAMRVK
jgi:ABC-type lipoprotein release transport system permease subunit